MYYHKFRYDQYNLLMISSIHKYWIIFAKDVRVLEYAEKSSSNLSSG